MIGELYPGEFEAMEHNGRMDALEQEPCEDIDFHLWEKDDMEEMKKTDDLSSGILRPKGHWTWDKKSHKWLELHG